VTNADSAIPCEQIQLPQRPASEKNHSMIKNPIQNLAHRREHLEEVQSPNQQHYKELEKSTSTQHWAILILYSFTLSQKTDIIGKLHDH